MPSVPIETELDRASSESGDEILVEGDRSHIAPRDEERVGPSRDVFLREIFLVEWRSTLDPHASRVVAIEYSRDDDTIRIAAEVSPIAPNPVATVGPLRICPLSADDDDRDTGTFVEVHVAPLCVCQGLFDPGTIRRAQHVVW
jgi:hypothetical protein